MASSSVYLSRLSDSRVQMQTADARSSFTEGSVLCMACMDILQYAAGWQFLNMCLDEIPVQRGDVLVFRPCFCVVSGFWLLGS